jgi:hypothetical protein
MRMGLVLLFMLIVNVMLYMTQYSIDSIGDSENIVTTKLYNDKDTLFDNQSYIINLIQIMKIKI